MKSIGKVLSAPFKLLGLVPKTPKLPAPSPTPTRDAARDMIINEDARRRRRGGAADILNSDTGAEAGSGAGGKDTLGS